MTLCRFLSVYQCSKLSGVKNRPQLYKLTFRTKICVPLSLFVSSSSFFQMPTTPRYEMNSINKQIWKEGVQKSACTYTGKICCYNSIVSLKSLWVNLTGEEEMGQNVLFCFCKKLRYMLNRNRIPYTVIFAYGWKKVEKTFFWYVYTNVQCKVGALSLMYGSHVQNRQVLLIFLIHFTVFFLLSSIYIKYGLRYLGVSVFVVV